MPPNPTGSHLNFDELADVTIDLNGSTLQLTQISLGVKIEGSERVVLKNGTIKGVGQLATIARVVADDTPAGIRFEVLPEYRTDLEQSTAGAPQLVTVGRVEHTPAAGYRVKVDGYAELFINRGASTNNFVYEDGSFVATSALSSQPYTPGDFVWLLHQNNSGHGLLIDNEVSNEDVSLENIVFTNIPGMAIVGEVVRGLHISNVKIVKDANDPNAFFAASSDALHINANGGDIIVENSVFDANGDDKINIKGNYWKVTALDRGQKTMTVQPVERNTSLNRWGWADQRVVFLGRDFTVEGETELATDSFRDNSKRHDLVLKSIPNGVDVGSLIGNVDNSGPRIVIRNNIFRDTRAQGVLVQTSHAVIDNNLFEGIAGPAIKLNLALDYWYEAINTRNILIKHNTFFKSSLSTQKSNELIYFNQYDGFGNDVEAIDNV